MPSSSRSDDDGEEEARARETARQLFSSLIFGWMPNNGDEGRESPSSTSATSGRAANPQQNQETHDIRASTVDEKSLTGPRADGFQQQVVRQVEKLIPEDPEELRKTILYQEAYKAIQWQRDNYLAGREYANWRSKERLRPSDQFRSIQNFQDEILFDATALAHGQLAKVGASFIPSDTVKLAVLPLVTPLFGGPLYPAIQRSMVHLVEGQQSNLDLILKNHVMKFLSNPENRKAIKTSTKGFISTTYHD